MAAFNSSTATAPAWDPFRVTITIGGAPTGAASNTVVYIGSARRGHDEYRSLGRAADPALFSARVLSALERRALRMQAAFERRVAEAKRHRLPTLPRPALPARRVARCCSLAASWRVRH